MNRQFNKRTAPPQERGQHHSEANRHKFRAYPSSRKENPRTTAKASHQQAKRTVPVLPVELTVQHLAVTWKEAPRLVKATAVPPTGTSRFILMNSHSIFDVFLYVSFAATAFKVSTLVAPYRAVLMAGLSAPPAGKETLKTASPTQSVLSVPPCQSPLVHGEIKVTASEDSFTVLPRPSSVTLPLFPPVEPAQPHSAVRSAPAPGVAAPLVPQAPAPEVVLPPVHITAMVSVAPPVLSVPTSQNTVGGCVLDCETPPPLAGLPKYAGHLQV